MILRISVWTVIKILAVTEEAVAIIVCGPIFIR